MAQAQEVAEPVQARLGRKILSNPLPALKAERMPVSRVAGELSEVTEACLPVARPSKAIRPYPYSFRMLRRILFRAMELLLWLFVEPLSPDVAHKLAFAHRWAG
jgi:hypothetical protein